MLHSAERFELFTPYYKATDIFPTAVWYTEKDYMELCYVPEDEYGVGCLYIQDDT